MTAGQANEMILYTIKLVPSVSIIDETTSILFDVLHLTSPSPKLFEDLSTRVTITDHDGLLFKFDNTLIPITAGRFSLNYIILMMANIE
jgi:hypothetical protein